MASPHPDSARHCGRDAGAVLVHVVFALLGVMALTALVVDFGVFWVSRGQAQNAADAGALAGAVSLAYDNPASVTDTAAAREVAVAVARRNRVWGAPPSVQPETDVLFGTCPDGVNTCARVNTYRTTDRGNPLPRYFGRLIGLDAQNIRATATAMVQPANASGCLKPWGIPDRWIENYPAAGPWLPTSTFDLYDKKGAPLPTPDVYVPPSETSAGSGFTLDDDLGVELTIKPSEDPIQPGFYAALQLSDSGGADFRYNISHCTSMTWAIGDRIPIEPGNMVGPTVEGVRDLIALDPLAHWVGGDTPIAGSCVDTGGCPGYTFSPRIVAVPLYDPYDYVTEDHNTGGHATVLVRNILGFFIAGLDGTSVVGYLVTGPGIYEPGSPTVPSGSAFLRTVQLVR